MRKRGKTIKNNYAVIPFGVKRGSYELSARAAMLALERGVYEEQNIVDLWVLADLCERLNEGKHFHITHHSSTVKRLCADIQESKHNSYTILSIISSAGVLLDWVHKQPNSKVLTIAQEQISRLCV